jgi:hypothetical protein
MTGLRNRPRARAGCRTPRSRVSGSHRRGRTSGEGPPARSRSLPRRSDTRSTACSLEGESLPRLKQARFHHAGGCRRPPSAPRDPLDPRGRPPEARPRLPRGLRSSSSRLVRTRAGRLGGVPPGGRWSKRDRIVDLVDRKACLFVRQNSSKRAGKAAKTAPAPSPRGHRRRSRLYEHPIGAAREAPTSCHDFRSQAAPLGAPGRRLGTWAPSETNLSDSELRTTEVDESAIARAPTTGRNW